jgi:lipoprotein signal peptidase
MTKPTSATAKHPTPAERQTAHQHCHQNSPQGLRLPYRRSGTILPAAAIAMIIGADQLSKWLAGAAGCGAAICPLRNSKLLLGTGPADPPLILASLTGLVVFALWALPAARRSGHARLAAAVGAGGITSNLLDRLLYGSVRDFLVIPGGFVINLADVAIKASLLCCGAVVLRHRHRAARAIATSDRLFAHDPDDERR